MLYQKIMNEQDYIADKIIQTSVKWPTDVNMALSYINNNFTKTGLNIQQVKYKCQIKNNSFSSKFKSFVGKSPLSYLNFLRINYSIKLINENKNISVAQIAFEVGYEYPSSFTNVFKKIVGCTPKMFIVDKTKG